MNTPRHTSHFSSETSCGFPDDCKQHDPVIWWPEHEKRVSTKIQALSDGYDCRLPYPHVMNGPPTHPLHIMQGIRKIRSCRQASADYPEPLRIEFLLGGWSFFWRPFFFFFRARFFFGWLVLARTVPLLQAVEGKNWNFCRVRGFATQHSF